MHRSLLKFKDYQVHSITTIAAGRINANMATWVMQAALKGKELVVAVYHPSLTHQLVSESGILNVNLLSVEQKSLVNRLGKKSGRDYDKFNKLPHKFDERGCPFLTEAIGYVQCEVVNQMQGLDHDLFLCKVLKQKVLNPEKEVLTHHLLKELGYIR